MSSKIKLKQSKIYPIFMIFLTIILTIGIVWILPEDWKTVIAVVTIMDYFNVRKKSVPTEDIETKLKKLDSLHQQNLITREEFNKKRVELLEKLQ
ncbi:MAG: SHOCT domain-containing protein [Oscillospiraceae bacterium]|nr:SHOCT domain-containing protein [Oscillospiraceae bacterium]